MILNPFLIESTADNRVSLVVRNSLIPLTALKKASLILAITFLKLSDLAYAIVKPATRAVIIDTVKPIGPVKATNALLSNPNPVLEPTAAEPSAFIGVTIGANTLRNIPKPPESLAIMPPKIPKPVSNGPAATTTAPVVPMIFLYLSSNSLNHLMPPLTASTTFIKALPIFSPVSAAIFEPRVSLVYLQTLSMMTWISRIHLIIDFHRLYRYKPLCSLPYLARIQHKKKPCHQQS